MVERQDKPFALSFHPSLAAGFQGPRVTWYVGLIPVRELEERLGSDVLIAEHPTDSQCGAGFRIADF